jgi:hypothetical protein
MVLLFSFKHIVKSSSTLYLAIHNPVYRIPYRNCPLTGSSFVTLKKSSVSLAEAFCSRFLTSHMLLFVRLVAERFIQRAQKTPHVRCFLLFKFELFAELPSFTCTVCHNIEETSHDRKVLEEHWIRKIVVNDDECERSKYKECCRS